MMSAPDKQTLAVYAAQIDTYVNMVEGLDNSALARFIEAMPKGGRVLDLGCGPGQIGRASCRERVCYVV